MPSVESLVRGYIRCANCAGGALQSNLLATTVPAWPRSGRKDVPTLQRGERGASSSPRRVETMVTTLLFRKTGISVKLPSTHRPMSPDGDHSPLSSTVQRLLTWAGFPHEICWHALGWWPSSLVVPPSARAAPFIQPRQQRLNLPSASPVPGGPMHRRPPDSPNMRSCLRARRLAPRYHPRRRSPR